MFPTRRGREEEVVFKVIQSQVKKLDSILVCVRGERRISQFNACFHHFQCTQLMYQVPKLEIV